MSWAPDPQDEPAVGERVRHRHTAMEGGLLTRQGGVGETSL